MNLRSLVFVVALLGTSVGLRSWPAGAAPVPAVACVGDCSGDGEVTITELVRGVSIAVGATSLDACRAFDRDGSGEVTVDELVLAVKNALEGCPVATPTRTPGMPTPSRTPTMTSQLELFDVGANFFSIKKPKGWDIHIAGVCSTLGILMRDPAVPLRQVFYFGLIGPVYLKEAQRQIDQHYIDSGGYNVITWLDAPAVDPLTTENFFTHWPDIADMKAATAFMPQFPTLTDLTVVSNTPQPSGLPTGSSALLRGVFMENGVVGEGQFLGTVWVFSPFTGSPAGGTAYGSILLGVTAPKREFKDVEARLIASLESFNMTRNYVDWCIAQQRELWGAVARQGQTLRETSDLIFDGWVNRSQASDIMAEKGSDAIRSVERVYDPATNQVYEVGAGWYADYDLHRGDYTMNGLQLLPNDSVELWTSAPADGREIR
jgi:hypothetical protein